MRKIMHNLTRILTILGLAAGAGLLAVVIGKNPILGLCIALTIAILALFIKKPYWGILVLLPTIAFIPYVPVGSLGFSIDDIAFLAILLIGGLYLFFKKEIKNNQLIFPFSLFAGASLISAIFNAANHSELVSMIAKGSIRVGLTLFFIIIIQNIIDSREKIYKLLYVLIGAATLESLFGILSFIFGYQGPYNIGIATSRSYSVLYNIIDGRVNGTFGSTLANFTGGNLLASYLILFIPITIALFFISKKTYTKIFLGIAGILQSICLVLTYSRSSIVYVGLAVLLMAALCKKWKLIFGAGAIGLILFVFTPGLQARFMYDSTNRFDIWRSAYLVAKDHFWFGVGPGNYLKELSSKLIYYRVFTFDTEVLTPHNSFLFTWATTGILGLISFIWIILVLIKQYWDNFRNSISKNDIILSSAFIASCAGFLMQNMTNNFFFVPTIALYFWAFTALVVNLNKKNYEKNNSF